MKFRYRSFAYGPHKRYLVVSLGRFQCQLFRWAGKGQRWQDVNGQHFSISQAKQGLSLFAGFTPERKTA